MIKNIAYGIVTANSYEFSYLNTGIRFYQKDVRN